MQATTQPSTQLTSMVEAIRGLCRKDNEAPAAVATLLWLMSSSEECQRTLDSAPPTREDLENLCQSLGDAARAWVQFSPAACDLLSRPVSAPARLHKPGPVSRRNDRRRLRSDCSSDAPRDPTR